MHTLQSRRSAWEEYESYCAIPATRCAPHCEQSLTAEKGDALALNDEMAIRLAQLGLKAEQLLGGPVDVEWGIYQRTLWLLQARAVTTLP